MNINSSGFKGEQFAAKMLQDKGFVITAKNYHTRYGEIDIIAKNDKYILFVEVKTRSRYSIGAPREFVNFRKQQKIINSALIYLSENKSDLQPRFDVVEVYINSKSDFSVVNFEHIENAFDAGT